MSMEIRCPRCNHRVKFKECVCKEKGRKRIMLYFPCYHFAELVYNIPESTDINTIIKDFRSISKEYFDRSYYLSHCRHNDRYL